MNKKILISILLLTLMACRNDDPEPELYHLTLGTTADAEVALGVYSADVIITVMPDGLKSV